MEFHATLACRNPHHPPDLPKRSMVCVRETREHAVFMCHNCSVGRRLESIQVKTSAWLKSEVRKQLKREGKWSENRPHPGKAALPRMNSELLKQIAERRGF